MRAVISCAVAAGATSSANTSSAPVICAVAATVSPSASMNASETRRTGTPLARATGSSTEANSSGRPTTAKNPNATTQTIASVSTCPRVIPRKSPNSRFS